MIYCRPGGQRGQGSPKYDVIHEHQRKQSSSQSLPCAHCGLSGHGAGGGKEWASHRAWDGGRVYGLRVSGAHWAPDASAPPLIFFPLLHITQASLKVTSPERLPLAL